MQKEFKFPDIGEGIGEGKIVKWLIKEGDIVEEHQVVGEIETDKAVAEIPSPYSGKIIKINFKEGETVKVGETLFVVEERPETARTYDISQNRETIQKYRLNHTKPKIGPAGAVGYLEEATEIEKLKIKNQKSKIQIKNQKGFKEILATPAVRELAKTLGVDLEKVKGTGPGGRITEEDVKKSKFQISVKKKYDMWGYIEYVPLTGIRRAIAKHMVEAVSHAPQVTIMDEMEASALVKVKEKAKIEAEKKGIYLTFLPFLMKALVPAMKEYPRINATLDEEAQEIIIKKYYNFGFAVDVDGEGLIVPVLKGVDQKDIFSIAKDLKELSDKARARKLDLQDLGGGTFTITNFGSLGSYFATPILNYPEVAILGVGRMREKPFVINGKIEIRPIMPFSLTFDHRVLDGAYAIRFLNFFMDQLQNPEKFI